MYVIFLSDAKESKDILVVNDSDNDDEKKVIDCFVSHCCRAVATGTAGTAGAIPVFSSRAGRGKEAGPGYGRVLNLLTIY